MPPVVISLSPMKKADSRKLKKSIYTAAQWTWGLPQTLIGAVLYAAHRKDRHFDYRGACATAWDRDSGISLGKFIFVPQSRGPSLKPANKDHPEDHADSFLLSHEYGHTLQSLILGPFYLILVGLPSIFWNRLPFFRNRRKKAGRSYYSAPFEKTANLLAAGKKRQQ